VHGLQVRLVLRHDVSEKTPEGAYKGVQAYQEVVEIMLCMFWGFSVLAAIWHK